MPNCAAEVTETGGGQQRVAHGVRGDVAVRVTLEPVRLVRPGEPSQVHRDPGHEPVDVDAQSHPPRNVTRHPPHHAATPNRGRGSAEGQSQRDDVPRCVVGGRSGRRRGRPRHELLRGDGADHPRVARRRGRRARHPDHPRPGRRVPHLPGRQARQAAAAPRASSSSWASCSPGRAASRGVRGGRQRWSTPPSPRSAAWPSRPSAARRRSTLLPVAVGFVTWLVTLSLLTEPLRAAEAQVVAAGTGDTASRSWRRWAPRPAGRSGSGSAWSSCAAGVLGVLGRVVGRGRRHVEEVRNLLRLPAGHPARGPRGRQPRGARDQPLDDAERRLLPDPHRDRRAGDRAQGLVAADPRDGRATRSP